jgi:hypothetical protein
MGHPDSVLGQNPPPNVKYGNQALDLGLRSNLTVNPITRAVELQIPLGNYPGRAGHDVSATLSYSSKVWNMAYQAFIPAPPPGHGTGQSYTMIVARYGEHSVAGWTSSIGFPVIDTVPTSQLYDQFGNPKSDGDCTAGCFNIDRIMVWMPDGSGHEFRSTDQPLIAGTQPPDNLYSVDGSRMRYQRSTQTLFLPNGSRYILSSPGGYIDRNGNTISSTDTLGRTILNPLGSVPNAPADQSYSVPGVGGNITYTLKWRRLVDVLTTAQSLMYVADSGCPPGNGSFTPHLFASDTSNGTCIQNANVQFNPIVLYQIVLPTQQAYTFTYNVYGEIDKVQLPTGGYEKYVYGWVAPLDGSLPIVYGQGNRGVVTRTISPTGLAANELPPYSYSAGANVSMTAPNGTRTDIDVWSAATASSWGYSTNGARAGRAYDERVYSDSGQMLRRKLTEWSMTGSNAGNAANRNPRVTRETEFILDTGGNALAKTTTYGYDTTFQFDVGADQTSVSEYDYVAIDQTTAQTTAITSIGSIPMDTLIRTTQTGYMTSDANYRNRNILGLPTSLTVYKGLPGDANVVSRSTISYDETSLLTFTPPTTWIDPQTGYRGNATTTSRWLNLNGSTLATFPQGTYTSHMRSSINSATCARQLTQTGISRRSIIRLPTITHIRQRCPQLCPILRDNMVPLRCW